ncbi:MAG TPA: amidohydrolase [Acidobacteriota bacterium]|nr:amidohydrolase [Acidobacteriota bacterium]
MSEMTRGEFLGLGAAAAAAIGATRLPASVGAAGNSVEQGVGPDLVVTNARVLTGDDQQPNAEAFAVRGSRFVAVGRSDDVANLVGPDTEVIDASGMCVTPGFIDAHSHPLWGGLQALVSVDTNLGSIQRIQDALSARARETEPGQWVVGFMYDDTKLSEGRPLDRRDLDEAVPDHPVYVGHRGGHTAVVNSAAFRAANITIDTPDPRGGTIYREGGEFTGRLAELALDPFQALLPDPSSREQRQAAVKLISELMSATGLTSVHSAGIGSAEFVAFQDAYAAGELGFRANLFANAGAYPSFRASGVRSGLGNEWLRLGPVKYLADGSASERTMRMSTPYMGRPDDYGILTMSQEEIHEAVEDAHRAGWQVAIHANGDVTIDMVLQAYERVQKLWPRNDTRHRIEHCSLVNPDLLRRIKDGGVIPAPFYTYAHFHGHKWVEYGHEKMEWMFAHNSFLEYEIPVAPASDWTPGPFEPLMAIQSMVTRKDYDGRIWGPSQRITVDQALQICTMHGAYASFEENLKGSITAGKLADFVLLAADPHDVDPDGIKEIPVVRTVVGGETRWQA